MKIQTENYTIENDHHGYSLSVMVPSEHEKSKTGFTQKVTFHANLAQVAEKMVNYEIKQADVKNVLSLAEHIESQVSKLTAALEQSK